ncbi:hypothetical protein VTI74DRAFT_5117 [Chaetomium olivicolor]
MARQKDLRPQPAEDGEPKHDSALFNAAREGKARICAVFGGQGSNNLTGLPDLIDLIQRCDTVVKTLIVNSAATLAELATQPHNSGFHEDVGFDLRAWLNDPACAPSPEFLALSPISFPINTLLSLAQYCITCHALGVHPGQLRGLLRGVTGHSQGLFAAVAIAKSDSWPSFYRACDEALRISFWVGLESHCAAPACTISAAAATDCISHGEGAPSSMLSIAGLDKESAAELVEATNKSIGHPRKAVHLALVNSRDKFILAGPPSSLRSVCVRLRQIKAPETLDQTRILSHKRKPTVDVHFLPVSAPYHSPYLAEVEARVCDDAPDLALSSRELGIHVYHTHTGQSLQSLKTNNLLWILIHAVTVDTVNWPQVIQTLAADGATHVLDFGPGQIGTLVRELTEGTVLRVIQISDRAGSRGVSGRAELLSSEMPATTPSWKEQFGPRLVADEQGGVRLGTKMTKVFGTPPVMVAGMTPTTVPWDFVAAVMGAGYHVELAGGGYWEEGVFEAAIRKLADTIPTGRGITCNLLYANPKTIAWQVSLLRRLAGDGIPIDGITIGAGIPSPDVVKEYIETIPGLRHISFKPGSLTSIHQVIDIAKEYPEFPIGLQWTGGRAGGHHSWEDFHQPILATYGRIRRYPNIILIAGSGFGGGHDTFPFLTGEWAHQFGYPSMPFDGVLLGSRMMVAKEAHTSPQAKELIIQAQGVGDREWHHSFDSPTGGVITIESEMGQPIHVLATRGMMLWKEFDQRIFSIRDKEKRLEYLRFHSDEIAERLNKDYFRPWFAVDASGQNIQLADMTYAEVLRRLCQLMYVHHQKRWIDESYRTLVHGFIRLSYERFCCTHGISPSQARPDILIQQFEETLGPGAHEMLYAEDVSLLVALFQRKGQKPVPFIPQLDEHFETWFKKDSLWQSEDVDAVIDQDANRVCIIQGPVAVRYSTTCGESAKTILDSICQIHVQMFQQKGHQGETTAPKSRISVKYPVVRGVRMETHGLVRRYQLTQDYDPVQWNDLVQLIVEDTGSWATAYLTDEWLFRGTSRVKNPVRAAFRPIPGDVVEVRRRNASVSHEIILIHGSGGLSKAQSMLKVSLLNREQVMVTLIPSTSALRKQAQIEFTLTLRPGPKDCRIHEDADNHVEIVKSLYSQLWIGDRCSPSSSQVAGLSSEFYGGEVVLAEKKVNQFLDVVGRCSPAHLQVWNPRGTIPIDYCVVVAWTALIKPLMIPALHCNLLQLLHRSIRFRYARGVRSLRFGDAVRTFSRITALTIQPTGTLVQVSADIRRQGERVVTIETEFFIRGGIGGGLEKQFSSVEEPELLVTVTSPVVNALLTSRKWLIFEDQSPELLGKRLAFRLTSHTMFNSAGDIALLQVSGVVALADESGGSRPIRLGRVYFEEESCSGNPVMDFLHRHGEPRTVRQQLESPGWAGPSPIIVHVPARSASYAAISGDTNPIHTCPLFARYAGLDGTVVHGMQTSAMVRRALEWALGDADRSRFKCWQASFEAVVCPNDRLRIEIRHFAMEEGRMVLEVQTFNDQTGEKVLEAEAEVEQPPTGYVFCGQGSQEKGMGMALYASRPEAKALWDRAETYLREHYGFSILHIVRDNPKTLTIHFGGKRGRRIRDRYLSMTRRIPLPEGGIREEPILAGLTPRSKSYTFSYPKGLLMSTQFSQPALALMEMAEYAHLQAKGVVQKGALFAGHSLGEYAALGACTSFMSFESLLSLIYFRGLKMQNALPRDPDGRTEYAMVAADPSRIGPEFDETCFQSLVQLITKETNLLLEVVNFNIRSQQYVCAGHFRPLWILTQISDALSSHPTPHALSVSTIRTMIRDRIPAASRLSNADPLVRGKATIPLTGIDIPFHSKALRGQIGDYREYLAKSIRPEDVKPEELVGKWIPNVVGEVFDVRREFVQRVIRTAA